MFYKQGDVAASETLYLTVPSDISSVSSITISVLTAAGQSTITRQAKSVTKTVTTTTKHQRLQQLLVQQQRVR